MTDDNTLKGLKAFKASQLAAAFKAKAAEPEPCTDCDDPVTAAGAGEVMLHGDMVLYDVMTGDGRIFDQDGFTWDLDLEGIPIIWDADDNDHDGPIIGRVDAAETHPGSVFTPAARLFAFEDPAMQKLVTTAAQLISENAIGWSIRFDQEVAQLTIKDPQIEESNGTQIVRMASDDDVYRVKSARIRHLALVDTPAFPGARPILGPPPALAASAALAVMPSSHFERWESRDPMPLQVTPDGRIMGHAAGDGCFRDGGGQCQKYQRDPDPTMANFHTGTTTLDDGRVIRTGVLTAAGLHAGTHLDLSGQRSHHENSSTVYAKVQAWEDSRGRLCISGSLVPGLEPKFAAQVAGLPVSVEKWPVQGVRGLTLVGAHAVPTPAWPVLT